MTVDVVFLLDVDSTLLDGDRMVADLHQHLRHALSDACAQRYWTVFKQLREELGYVDYLGALQRYRQDIEPGSASEQRLLTMAAFLLDYPFAERLFPRALEVVKHLGSLGQTVILTDGDVCCNRESYSVRASGTLCKAVHWSMFIKKECWMPYTGIIRPGTM